ncbi:hypothetical protein RvY_09831 [Ramazzottius varieornatus]|uniref:Uncharacterized protein n=1 Tax=Ramazzottius varieornatus TaxID=947166 RepID=A0A1D1VF54_RAMVA|nr:hypothetical protein RvY_09831 [Ramazzottius varieornatus]
MCVSGSALICLAFIGDVLSTNYPVSPVDLPVYSALAFPFHSCPLIPSAKMPWNDKSIRGLIA